jgi:hypothetical protein
MEYFPNIHVKIPQKEKCPPVSPSRIADRKQSIRFDAKQMSPKDSRLVVRSFFK